LFFSFLTTNKESKHIVYIASHVSLEWPNHLGA